MGRPTKFHWALTAVLAALLVAAFYNGLTTTDTFSDDCKAANGTIVRVSGAKGITHRRCALTFLD